MVRTQIQFTAEQIKELRRFAAASGRSIADLTRDAVAEYIKRNAAGTPEVVRNRALSVAGKFGSGRSDVSSRHDQYLRDAFGK